MPRTVGISGARCTIGFVGHLWDGLDPDPWWPRSDGMKPVGIERLKPLNFWVTLKTRMKTQDDSWWQPWDGISTCKSCKVWGDEFSIQIGRSSHGGHGDVPHCILNACTKTPIWGLPITILKFLSFQNFQTIDANTSLWLIKASLQSYRIKHVQIECHLPSLKLTFSHLKMDGWIIFRVFLLVSGSVHGTGKNTDLIPLVIHSSWGHQRTSGQAEAYICGEILGEWLWSDGDDPPHQKWISGNCLWIHSIGLGGFEIRIFWNKPLGFQKFEIQSSLILGFLKIISDAILLLTSFKSLQSSETCLVFHHPSYWLVG